MGTQSSKYNVTVFYTVEYCGIPYSHIYLTCSTHSLLDEVHTVRRVMPGSIGTVIVFCISPRLSIV